MYNLTHKELNSTYWYQYILHHNVEEILNNIKEEFIEIDGKRIIWIFMIIQREVHVMERDIYSWNLNIFAILCRILLHVNEIWFSSNCTDMPGHGLSDGIRGHFTMSEAIRTIKELVTILQVNTRVISPLWDPV